MKFVRPSLKSDDYYKSAFIIYLTSPHPASWNPQKDMLRCYVPSRTLLNVCFSHSHKRTLSHTYRRNSFITQDKKETTQILNIMKELTVRAGPKTTIIDSPIPVPGPDHILIKVVVSGSNPKDWKRPEWRGDDINQGDDIAGIVHQVGEKVTEFKVRKL